MGESYEWVFPPFGLGNFIERELIAPCTEPLLQAWKWTPEKPQRHPIIFLQVL